jgi:hypothetical protein
VIRSGGSALLPTPCGEQALCAGETSNEYSKETSNERSEKLAMSVARRLVRMYSHTAHLETS